MSPPFAAGEELVFELSWLGIRAGTATMSVAPPAPYRGREAYRFTTRARSTPFFSKIFPVDDRLESWVDAETFHSLRFEKNLSEGKRTSHEETVFDPVLGLAWHEGVPISVPPRVQDTLSAFYYVRTLELVPGLTHVVDVHAGGKNRRLEVDVLLREWIDTPFGRRLAVKIEPKQRYEGVFDQRGRLFVWLSDDRGRLPLLMRSSLAIGSIVARLVDYRVTPPPEPTESGEGIRSEPE